MPTSNQDPTRTTGIRRKMAAEAFKRFRFLKGQVREILQTWPAEPDLGLSEGFMEWLDGAVERIILARDGGPVARMKTNRTHSDAPQWMAIALDQAFDRGMRQAVNEIEKQMPDLLSLEAVAKKQATQRRKEAMITRALEELTNATQQMQTQIRRELVSGIEAGEHPRVIARRINDRVDKVGVHRARMIARTEVVRAHHKAQMSAYREAEADGVKVKAEWSTAGDGRVCEECQSLEGRIYSMDEIENMIPVHPNCRCSATPWFEGAQDEQERRREAAAKRAEISRRRRERQEAA